MHPLLCFKKFIYVVISKKIKFWFIKQIKYVFQGFETQTVWSDWVNWKPPIKEVLLTLITGYYKKFCEPWEPPFNLPGLTVLTAQTIWVFFFFWLLTAIIVEASSLQLQPPTVRLSKLRLHAIFVLHFFFYVSIALSLSLRFCRCRVSAFLPLESSSSSILCRWCTALLSSQPLKACFTVTHLCLLSSTS